MKKIHIDRFDISPGDWASKLGSWDYIDHIRERLKQQNNPKKWRIINIETIECLGGQEGYRIWIELSY